MSFGAFDPQRQQAMMSDINVTPMVDVMLVLLVIFILAAPLFTHRVQLDLPQAGGGAAQQQADVMAIAIAIDAAGVIYLGANRRTLAQLDAHFARVARSAPQPEVQLRADRNTRYEVVAQVMATAQARGLTRIVFVTEPGKESKDGKR